MPLDVPLARQQVAEALEALQKVGPQRSGCARARCRCWRLRLVVLRPLGAQETACLLRCAARHGTIPGRQRRRPAPAPARLGAQVVDTVPADVLAKAQQMLETARAAERAALEGQQAGGGGASSEDEKLLQQFLPSSQ